MPNNRRKAVRIVLIAILITLTIVCIFAYRNLGLWLVVSDPLPQSLDAIFTFAGDNDRIPYSKQLCKRYPKALWIVSYPSKNLRDSLSAQGFDTSRIVMVDTGNTFSEADCYVCAKNV